MPLSQQPCAPMYLPRTNTRECNGSTPRSWQLACMHTAGRPSAATTTVNTHMQHDPTGKQGRSRNPTSADTPGFVPQASKDNNRSPRRCAHCAYTRPAVWIMTSCRTGQGMRQWAAMPSARGQKKKVSGGTERVCTAVIATGMSKRLLRRLSSQSRQTLPKRAAASRPS